MKTYLTSTFCCERFIDKEYKRLIYWMFSDNLSHHWNPLTWMLCQVQRVIKKRFEFHEKITFWFSRNYLSYSTPALAYVFKGQKFELRLFLQEFWQCLISQVSFLHYPKRTLFKTKAGFLEAFGVFLCIWKYRKKAKIWIFFFADFSNNRIGTAAVTVDPNMDQFLAENKLYNNFSILIIKVILYNEIS